MMAWEANVTRVPLATSMLLSRHVYLRAQPQAARNLGLPWDTKGKRRKNPLEQARVTSFLKTSHQNFFFFFFLM